MLIRRTYSNNGNSGKYQTCFGDGGFRISSDCGKTWEKIDLNPSVSSDYYDLAISLDGKCQFFSATNATVSSDYGNTWRNDYYLGGTYGGVVISSDGKYMATFVGRILYNSSDYGNTWDTYIFTSQPPYRDCLGMSADGRYMVASLYIGSIHVSSDYGKTWKEIADTSNYRSYANVRISKDGKYMSACIGLRGVLVSSDYGNTWNNTLSGGKGWMAFAMSGDGKYMVAKSAPSYGVIMTSSDYGNTWKEVAGSWFCTSMEMSSNGKYILGCYAATYAGKVHLSSDYGNTWRELLLDNITSFQDCAVSADGKYMTIVLDRNNAFCHVSSDYGVTWQKSSFEEPIGVYRIAMNK